MSPADVAQYVRWKTRTDSTSFPDSEMLLLLNMFKDDFAEDIVDVNEDYFGMPYTTDLVEDRREYPFPTDNLIKLKQIEAKLDGTNFIKLEELDLNQYRGVTDETTITKNFNNIEGEAFYDLFRESIWIYSGSITDVTNGLKLWGFLYPSDITDMTSTQDMSIPPSTTEHGIPRALHRLLAMRMVIEYKNNQDTPIPLDEREKMFDKLYERALEKITNVNLDRSYEAQIPEKTDRGNDGWNY